MGTHSLARPAGRRATVCPGCARWRPVGRRSRWCEGRSRRSGRGGRSTARRRSAGRGCSYRSWLDSSCLHRAARGRPFPDICVGIVTVVEIMLSRCGGRRVRTPPHCCRTMWGSSVVSRSAPPTSPRDRIRAGGGWLRTTWHTTWKRGRTPCGCGPGNRQSSERPGHLDPLPRMNQNPVAGRPFPLATGAAPSPAPAWSSCDTSAPPPNEVLRLSSGSLKSFSRWAFPSNSKWDFPLK